MAVRVNRNQCFFLATVSLDWASLARGLESNFFRVEAVPDGLDLIGTMPDAPSFRVREIPKRDVLPSCGLKGGPIATEWRRYLGEATHVVSLGFDDLHHVLDETNCLIEAQGRLQQQLRALFINGWNRAVTPFGG